MALSVLAVLSPQSIISVGMLSQQEKKLCIGFALLLIWVIVVLIYRTEA